MVTAADNAYVALPCCAKGNPSTIVAADELAPGIPNNTEVNVSPVVDAATTATMNITAKYGSTDFSATIKGNSATRPVVAPAAGIIPINKPYTIPANNAAIANK